MTRALGVLLGSVVAGAWLLVAAPVQAICCGATCCFIDGACRTTGQVGPSACLLCDPSESQTQWSVQTGKCFIGGTCRDTDEVNPSNDCQICKPAMNQTGWSNNAVACDDGDMCTTSDACSGGSCGGTPVDCSSLDDVCVVGVCQPGTGTCAAEDETDGAACDDGDTCTVGDDCESGACTSGVDMCVDGALPPVPDAGSATDAAMPGDDDAGAGAGGTSGSAGSGGASGDAGPGGGTGGSGSGATGGGAADDGGSADGSSDAGGDGGGGCGCGVVGRRSMPVGVHFSLWSAALLGLAWRVRRRWA